MDPARQDFIDATLAGMPDSPRAREVLETAVMLSSTLPPREIDDPPEMAAERMRSQAPDFRERSRLLVGATALVSGIAAWYLVAGPPAWRAIQDIWDANNVSSAMGSMCCAGRVVPRFPSWPWMGSEERAEALLSRATEKLSEKSVLLLFGDRTKMEGPDRWKPIADAYPDDPAHYFIWAGAHHDEHGRWPDGFLSEAERLDPDNGYYRFLSGVTVLKGSLGTVPVPRITRAEKMAARAKGLPPPPTPIKSEKPVIVDESAFREGWAMMEDGLDRPQFSDPSSELTRVYRLLLPPAWDYAGFSRRLLSRFYTAESRFADPIVNVSKIRSAFTLRREVAVRSADIAEVDRLAEVVSTASAKLLNINRTALATIVGRNLARSGGEECAEGYLELSQVESAAKWQSVADALNFSKGRSTVTMTDALSEGRGSGLVNAFSITMERAPGSLPVSDEELRGGRMAERALYDRFMLHLAGGVILLAVAFLLLVPAFTGRTPGPLAARLGGLLTGRDHLAIAAWGVVLPLALYAVSAWHPLVMPRDKGLGEVEFYLRGMQALAMVLAVLLGTREIVQSRLGRRGAVAGFMWFGPPLALYFWVTSLVAIPGIGLVARFMPADDEWSLWACAGLLAFPLGGLLCMAVSTIKSASTRELHRTVIARAMLPFTAAAALLVSAGLPWKYAEEKRWTKEIHFEQPEPTRSPFDFRTDAERWEWQRNEALDALSKVAPPPPQ